jgi:hypothetical protein
LGDAESRSQPDAGNSEVTPIEGHSAGKHNRLPPGDGLLRGDSRATGRGEADSSGAPAIRRVYVGCLIALIAQLIVVLLASDVQYSRFGLGVDFSTYNQAVFLISHGHLLPFDTTIRQPYLDDHFGLLLYPIALLYSIFPHGVLLLWLQDLAGVAAEVAVLRWIYEVTGLRFKYDPGRGRASKSAVLVSSALVMLLNPWFYTACLFDFHLNAFATLLLVLVLRDAWRRRLGWAALWAGVLLLTGDTGGIYLAGAGLSIAVARGTWRSRFSGVVAVLAGCVWLVFSRAVAVKHNPVLASSYTWLVTGSQQVPGRINPWTVLKAVIIHPHRQIQWICRCGPGHSEQT